jgi:superfamily I DNA and/or RNA helicase
MLGTTPGKPDAWNDKVKWFPELTDIGDPSKALCALTYPDGKAGQANLFEASLVCAIVQNHYLKFSTNLENELDSVGNVLQAERIPYTPESFWNHGMGIVTPHRAQRALVVRLLREIFPLHPLDLIDSAVDTVERFQGGQRDAIVISFGVGDPDLIADEESFLLQMERTNVAISRARAKCMLVISEDLAFHLPSDKETILTSKALKTYLSDICKNPKTFATTDAEGRTVPLMLKWQ